MACSMRRKALSTVLPVATQPGRSGTDAPQSLRGSRLMRTRYCSRFMAVADNSVVVSDQRLLWCQRVICEERTSAGATILRAFRDGQETASGNQYFAKDHLSSIRTVVDGSGAALATYSFDPWGRRLLASGSDVTTRGFTGLRVADEGSMAALRAYDADAGRWLGQDPIGVADGQPLYVRSQQSAIVCGPQWRSKSAVFADEVLDYVGLGSADTAVQRRLSVGLHARQNGHLSKQLRLLESVSDDCFVNRG